LKTLFKIDILANIESFKSWENFIDKILSHPNSKMLIEVLEFKQNLVIMTN